MATSSQLSQVIRVGVREEQEASSASPNPAWNRLRQLGTYLWLDTGDMDEAARLWSAEFTAHTTNNTLLNKEIQKGIYDDWIPSAADAARADQGGLEGQDLVLEIAFALNARHGLRLVERFNADVSVELHTALAHDVERSVAYGERYHSLCPERFIVKVPLTPHGLVAARRLTDQGIRVNFTLGFSARENVLISCVARPDYLNVFLGRLNAYVADEGLGDGQLVGERTTLATQSAVRGLREKLGTRTRLIAASMRSGEQVEALAGLDVYTMPLGVAEGFLADAPNPDALKDNTGRDYQPSWADGVDPVAEGLDDLWNVSAEFEAACLALTEQSADSLTPDGIVDALHDAGVGGVLPRISDDDVKRITEAGKMPKRSQWRASIADGSVGLDALFTQAGLYSFAQDQAALDERIRKMLD
jgi:transaldolase